MRRPPPRSTLFPYTTLFRSQLRFRVVVAMGFLQVFWQPDAKELPGQVDANHDDDHDGEQDRKSTRLNSSHANISYAVFCLKKKNNERVSNTINKPSA